MHFKDLNDAVRATPDRDVTIVGCLGQRYIASGCKGKRITVEGIPGNALGAYMDGSTVTVFGNVQEATGDTMNDGEIVIHGNAGDATGYGMRGGTIFVLGDTGTRAGIHMKEYGDKKPVLVIGGRAGCFLGEYQAGGTIVVLGLSSGGKPPVDPFCGTGMHGGEMILRCGEPPQDLPPQVSAQPLKEADFMRIRPLLEEFCQLFGQDAGEILKGPFYRLTPNAANPYKRLYTSY